MQDEGYKRCSKCGEIKPRDAFGSHRTTADGLRPDCRACVEAYNRAYRERNAAHLRITKSAYSKRTQVRRRKPCALCGGPKPAGERRHYCDPCRLAVAEINADRSRLRASTWYAVTGHREVEYQIHRQQYAAFVEDVDSLVVLERHDGVCGICGEDVNPLRFDVDHIVPLARGGEHSYSNTQPAHPSCNYRKGAKAP